MEIVEAGGGTTNDIVKITIYLKDHANRAELNDEWQKMFPDPANRLARQAMAGNPNPDQDVECDFVAVIAGASESD
ncbi:MAG: RidA family protein [Chromatiales bacterium]|nr:RidA family protein [Chromatiales bacterium]